MDIGWKLVSTAAGLAAGVASKQILDVTWRAFTGHKPPEDDDFGSYDLVEAIVFATVSGAVVGLTRHLAMEAANKWYGGPVDHARK